MLSEYSVDTPVIAEIKAKLDKTEIRTKTKADNSGSESESETGVPVC